MYEQMMTLTAIQAAQYIETMKHLLWYHENTLLMMEIYIFDLILLQLNQFTIEI